MEPNFEEMDEFELWDYIEEDSPPNDVLLVASAISIWNSLYGEEYEGYTPESGGGRKGGLPPHG